jgi:hypothetical protein
MEGKNFRAIYYQKYYLKVILFKIQKDSAPTPSKSADFFYFSK